MRRRRSGGHVFWILAAMVVMGLAWLWFRTNKVAGPISTSTSAPSPTTPGKLRPSQTEAAPHSLPAETRPAASQAAPSTGALQVQKAVTKVPSASAAQLSSTTFSGPAIAPAPKPPAAISNRSNLPETVDSTSSATSFITNPAAGGSSGVFPRPIQNVFELQVALARQGLSCGSIDGRIGPQSRAALTCFQQREHLSATGQLDDATRAALLLKEAPLTQYEITSNDLARLQPLSATWLGKSKQSALDYETVLELVAEKSQAHPNLIRRLNPTVDWTNLAPGTVVELPSVCSPAPHTHAAFISISLSAKTLEAWDSNTNLLAHFPCSIARQVEKRPVGELHVAVIALNPNYTFDPENFPESPEAHELSAKLILPPGPNNPVGTAWIGLDKPGYGIHGTPQPEQVGRTESHGCFRLANWNAEYLARLVEIGTPVYVQP